MLHPCLKTVESLNWILASPQPDFSTYLPVFFSPLELLLFMSSLRWLAHSAALAHAIIGHGCSSPFHQWPSLFSSLHFSLSIVSLLCLLLYEVLLIRIVSLKFTNLNPVSSSYRWYCFPPAWSYLPQSIFLLQYFSGFF